MTSSPAATSLIYSHILWYRSAMQLLYRGQYHRRFRQVVAQIPPGTTTICELCFGDTWIARWCRDRGLTWSGYEVNPYFGGRALRLGFDARVGDVLAADLPAADVYVMAGSLYHFHEDSIGLLRRMWARTDQIILSEPIENLSSRPGVVGWLARRAAKPGTRPAPFRYTFDSMMAMLERGRAELGFQFTVASRDRDLVVVLTR